MLRLSPPGNQRFFQTHSFDVEFGGSEANVGAALAFWGLHVSHLTAFPDNEIGWAASGQLRKKMELIRDSFHICLAGWEFITLSRGRCSGVLR